MDIKVVERERKLMHKKHANLARKKDPKINGLFARESDFVAQ